MRIANLSASNPPLRDQWSIYRSVVRFTRDELEAFRDVEIDDLAGPGMRLAIVGINPGLWTAAVSAHFARRGNRFWPAMHRAGVTSGAVDASGGMPDDAASELISKGVGITNLVARTTARADELTASELRAGASRLEQFVIHHAPRVVAVLGISAYRVAFDDRSARQGRQEGLLGDAELWVLGNPSGLNAHESVDTLAAALRRAAVAAGISVQ